MDGKMSADTLNLEDHARLSLNFLCGAIDLRQGGLPYFYIFLKPDPPEKRHAWPDYGDITGRFVDAFILAHQMTGDKRGEREEKMLKELMLSYFSENDGISYRPDTAWSKHDALMFDQGRVLMALTTWYLQTGENKVKKVMEKMIDGLWNIAYKEKDYCYYPYNAYPPSGWNKEYYGGRGTGAKADPGHDGGQFILSLVRFYQATKSEAALNLAKNLTNWLVYHSDIFDLDKGNFKYHFHSRMATVAGILRYASATKNSELIEWAKRVYDYALSISGSFGWYPENTENKEGCETCCICDMIDGAILLAKVGYPEYWNIVERTVRNHLIENQLRDISWIKHEKHKEDTKRSSFNNVAQRIRGAFAGWSAPNDLFGRRKEKPSPYQLMNCCGPAGVHALYLVWDNIVTKDEQGIWVNLSLNRDSQWVRINSFRPYQGKVEILIKQAPVLYIRVPEWVPKGTVIISGINGKKGLEWTGDYLKLNDLKKGQLLSLTYPLRDEKQKEEIGGGEFLLHWKGDTVVKISPQGKIYPLYQRKNYLAREAPQKRVSFHLPVKELHW